MLGWATSSSRASEAARRCKSPFGDVLLEVLEAVHELHVGANPLALELCCMVCIIDTELWVAVETVCDDQTCRAASTLLAVNKDLLALPGPLVYRLTELHKIGSNIGVVVPRHMNILGGVERVRLWGCRRV